VTERKEVRRVRLKVTGPGAWLILPLLSVVSLAASGSDLRLVTAAKERDQQAVRSLLKAHADVNATQPDGATALHWAAHWDDLETAELLIRAGAKVSAVNDYGVTPLSVACTNANAAMVEKLLQAGANANAALPTGETALMTCARTGNAEAVKSLLVHGAGVNAQQSENAQTALMWAVAQKHSDAARALIERGANIHARSKGGFTPLLFAARVGDVDSTRVLLAAGADVNEAVPVQASPRASRAAAPGGPDSAETPKSSPENPASRSVASPPSTAEPQPGSMNPLLLASASGHEALSLFLLENGADPNASDGSGATALHYAVLKGMAHLNGIAAANYQSYLFRPSMVELVQALLAHRANPNARLVKGPPVGGFGGRSVIGATPFLLAAAAGDANVMRLLAAGGADPLLGTKGNLTPLMVAAGVGRAQDFTEEEKSNALEAVKVAVELGGDVNAASEDGLAALHGASVNGADAILQFLADNGARLDVKDKYQQTPLTIASGIRLPWVPKGEELGEIKRASTADLLLKLGATPLTAPNYFTPVAQDSDVFRMNQSQRYEEVPAPR
jgi:ankyrin repeat protein